MVDGSDPQLLLLDIDCKLTKIRSHWNRKKDRVEISIVWSIDLSKMQSFKDLVSDINSKGGKLTLSENAIMSKGKVYDVKSGQSVEFHSMPFDGNRKEQDFSERIPSSNKIALVFGRHKNKVKVMNDPSSRSINPL